ncbi:MAG: DUF4405 domain-containing protein [Methylobacter sp.]
MSRTIITIFVDVAAALLFLGMIATGYVLRFILPPGSNRAFSLWGLTHHQFGDLHFWISIALLSVLVIHLTLHWKWIVSVAAKRYHRAQASYSSLLYSGVLTLVMTTIAFMAFTWTAQLNVKPIARPAPEPAATDKQPGSTSVVPSLNGDPEIVFWKNIYPIFEKNCLSCHGPQRQYAGFRADNSDNFFRNIGSKPLVLPGRSDDSPLIAIVSGARGDLPMAEEHTLSEHEVLLLKAWIDAGAEWPASLPEQ